MEALELYKFITDKKLEWHWNASATNVILFVENYHIEEWNKLLSGGLLEDEGVECNMKDGYFGFMMDDICGYYGIELEEIFNKKDWDS